MNVITDTLRQLVRRKLWPVALVLLGALAAVPLLLAKHPETAAVAQAANARKVEALPSTFVSVADTSTDETAKRRRVLGAVKDPFEPAPLPKAKKKKKAKARAKPAATATPTPASASAGTPATGGGGTSTPTPPVSAAPTPAPAPTITVPAYSVKVRFGTTDTDQLTESTVERLSVLPDETNPVLVYRGVEDGGKVAVFELTGDVDAQGDGTCAPTPEDCQYVRLHAGETEFVTVTGTGDDATDAQYQLDLVKIYKKATKEKATDATATQSLAKASSISLKSKAVKLRHRNRYVFNSGTGTLRLARGHKTPVSAL